jgi:hypothetical protein
MLRKKKKKKKRRTKSKEVKIQRDKRHLMEPKGRHWLGLPDGFKSGKTWRTLVVSFIAHSPHSSPPSTHLPICLFPHPSISPYICPPIHLSSIFPFFHPSIHPPTHPGFHHSVTPSHFTYSHHKGSL